MFRRSLAFSLAANLSVAFCFAGSTKAGPVPSGSIKFTADNAAQIFLNGQELKESGGREYTNNWQQPFEFDAGSELLEGRNVISVAAWDHEGIAAVSGIFKMVDGTTFGTSSRGWLVFDAGIRENNCEGTNDCTDFPRSLGNAYKNPAAADLIRIPSNWNSPDIQFAAGDMYDGGTWMVPGKRIGAPWENGSPGSTTGDKTWIWWGDDSSKQGGFYKVNFALFRFEFNCIADYCAPTEEWEERFIINQPRVGSQIISSSKSASGVHDTHPLFAGGTLSFSANQDDYSPNFYVSSESDMEGLGLGELWNADGNSSENTIDVGEYNVTFTGVLVGPGGMRFSGVNGVTTLAGKNTYSGKTAVSKGSTLKVTGSLSDATTVTVDGGGTYQVSSDDTIFGLQGAGRVKLDGKTLTVSPDLTTSTSLSFGGEIAGNGDFVKAGGGTQVLTGKSTYEGATSIENGALRVSGEGDLPDSTPVAVSAQAEYIVNSTDTIGSLAGNGGVVLGEGKVLSAGAVGSTEFSGVISGSGGFTKLGSNTTTTLSGRSIYTGTTTIKQGTLKLGAVEGLPSSSTVVIKPSGVLDLGGLEKKITVDPNNEDGADVFLDGGAGAGTIQQIMANTAVVQNGILEADIVSDGGLLNGVSEADLLVRSGRTFIKNTAGTSLDDVVLSGGQLWIANRDLAGNSQSVTVDDFTLATKTIANPVAPTSANFSGVLQDGLVIGFDSQADYALVVSGDFVYESGNVYLYKPMESSVSDYEGVWNAIDFDQSDLTEAEYKELFKNTALLYQDPEGGYTNFGFKETGRADQSALIRPVALQKGSLRICVGSVFGDECGGMETPPAEIEDQIQEEISQDTGMDLDDGVVIDLAEDFGLWTSDEIVNVVQRGLVPRNVDGAGQTMATYNNLLADTIFERTPMRQFTEVEPEVAVEPIPESQVVPASEPVRGLWAKSGAVDDADADAYLDEKTAAQPLVMADAHTAAEYQEQHLISINGKTYVENDSLTAEYAGRDGVRGWFRGFGGQSADSNGETDTIYNPYGISAGGGIVGADVSLSESFQLGAYANYGDINLWQTSGVEGLGGGWNADGWGGGVTADYWTNNFYVQGLLGASGFSGEQKRSIKGYGVLFDDDTTSGEKSATTTVGALRIGAPFQSGSTYIEPQFTATWTGNSENRFSESAEDDRLGLTYKSRSTNYLQTALGLKFAWPMKTGDTGLFTPSVKVAWLGDWNQGNEDQTIGFDFTDQTHSVESNQEDVNGALIEAGLDYNVAKVEGTTVKAYVRGGAEVWGGNRGTQWRASGGVTFQF